ncbi:MAG: SUMF1/EgtB/PvdO family nonheme iron enzyme, partial [Armatimonadota bacterium]
ILAENFPKGYGAFYCMKYRVSRAEYAGFMNTLTPKQADRHYHPRIVIRSGKAPNYTYAAHKWTGRYKNGALGLSWADGAAFAAWAGLRPMTELELEKAVRGPRNPKPDEVLASYWNVQGFADNPWHAMKMEKQTERVVTVGNATGRRFKGTHGRGTLTLPDDWPQEDAIGAGMRVSWWGFHRINHKELARTRMSDPPIYDPMSEDGWWELPRTRLSDRLYADLVDPKRRPLHQWRGVRTAPSGVGP